MSPFHVEHFAVVFHGGREPLQDARGVDPAAVRRPHVVAEVLLVEEAEDRHQLALDGVGAQGSRGYHILNLILPRRHIEAAVAPKAEILDQNYLIIIIKHVFYRNV